MIHIFIWCLFGCDDLFQKACILFTVRDGHPRATILLRLPPANVSVTPEVRCAVVGNVDSGKSTTLGVLTRGKHNALPIQYCRKT